MTGVQTCALPLSQGTSHTGRRAASGHEPHWAEGCLRARATLGGGQPQGTSHTGRRAASGHEPPWAEDTLCPFAWRRVELTESPASFVRPEKVVGGFSTPPRTWGAFERAGHLPETNVCWTTERLVRGPWSVVCGVVPGPWSAVQRGSPQRPSLAD